MRLNQASHLSGILLCFVIAATSCSPARMMNKQVAKQYDNQLPVPKKTSSNIIISSKMDAPGSQLSTTKGKTSNFLPLLVYWSWNYKTTCSLNPQIPLTQFTNTVNKYASSQLQPKLTDSKLELSIDTMPSAFAINDKSHLVFLLLYSFSWENVALQADQSNLVVNYKLTKADNETKTGTISIPFYMDDKGIGYFKSWKKATAAYLTDYNENIARMSKKFVDELAAQL